MTLIRFACPGCQTTLKVADPKMAGRKIKCPMCQTVTRVPAAPAPLEPAPEMDWSAPPPPARAPAASSGEDEALAALLGAGPEAPMHNGAPAPVLPPTEELQIEAPPAHKPADEIELEADEALAPRKRGREIEDEYEEDRPARPPRSKPAPAAKKGRGNLLMAIFVTLIVLAYGGALGATLAGTFDEKPPETMTEDEALKVFKLDKFKDLLKKTK